MLFPGPLDNSNLDATGPSIDEIYALLGNDYRRAILRTMDPSDAPTELETLATHLAIGEPALSDDSKEVAIELHHCHLPKLAAADVLRYDYEDLLIEPGPAFEDVHEYLP